MPTTPIANKLRIGPADRFVLVDAPPGYAAKLGVKAATGVVDGVLVFVRSTRDLLAARDAAKTVKPDGLIWIAYPKGGALKTDLNRDVLRESLDKHGLTGVSLVALDETWSAMRFKRAAMPR